MADRVKSALCAPDKFRGSLSGPQAAAAMATGLRDVGIEAVELPLADGGEGTLDAMVAACGGVLHEDTVTGPDGNVVVAAWALLPGDLGIIELAKASGLSLVRGKNDPASATSRGTGELIVAAARRGARRIILGVGGSATVDGGLGALEALSFALPVPVTVAYDVETPFTDAAIVFGPQKGASAAEVELLTLRLHDLADRYRAETGCEISRILGGGAAGGIAGGLAAYGAELRPGFDVVAEACRFGEALAGASFVLTGEGRLDRTSRAGKVVGRVLAVAAGAGVPAGVIAGAVDPSTGPLPGDPPVVSLVDNAPSTDAAFAQAAERVRVAAADLGRRLSST